VVALPDIDGLPPELKPFLLILLTESAEATGAHLLTSLERIKWLV
jgi:hypothetical protein